MKEPRWTVSFEGETITRDTITIGEAIAFGDMRFKDIDLADPAHVVADRVALLIGRVMLNDPELKTRDDAMRAIQAKPLDSLVVTEFLEDEPDPKGGSTPDTP